MAERASIILDAEDRTAAAFASARRNLSALDSASQGLSRSLGLVIPALSGTAIAAFAKSGIDAADALNDMSQRLSVSVKDLASFKLAAQLADTSLEGVANGISRLTRSIGEAEGGNKQLAKSLQELGITSRDPKEAFFQLADAVKEIEDPSKRAALLAQVLGKSYQELLPLLSQGSDELRRSAAASEGFAEAMARLAPDASKFNDALDTLKFNAAGAAAKLLSELVPALNEVFERFSRLSQLRDAGASIMEIVTGRVNADTSATLRRMNAEIGDLEKTIARLVRNSGGLDSSIKPLTAELQRLKGVRAELFDMEIKRLMTPPKLGAAAPAVLAPSGGWTPPAAPSKTKKTPADYWAEDVAEALKAANAEMETYAENAAFVAAADLEREQAIHAVDQSWVDAAASLKNKLMPATERYRIEVGRLQTMLDKGLIRPDEFQRAVAMLDTETRRMSESIEQSLTDALLRGFEGGKDLASNFVGTLKNMFSTLVLRPIIQPIAQYGSNMVMGMLGMGASGSAMAGGMGGAGDIFGIGSSLMGAMAPGAISTGTGVVVGGIAESLGASSAFAGSLGAGVATALPWLGAIAALGSMAGLFGGKPSNKSAGGVADLTTGEISDLWNMTGEKQASQETMDARSSLLTAIGGYGTALTHLGATSLPYDRIGVDVGERDGVQFKFDGGALQSYGNDPNAAVAQLFRELALGADGLSESLQALLGYFDGTAEEFGSFTTALISLQEYANADPLTAAAEAAEAAGRSAWQVWQDQGTDLRVALAAWDGSAAATAELATLTQARYQTEYALAQQINAALASTSVMFAATAEEMRFSTLDQAGQYEFLRDKSAELETALQAATDPAEIEALAKDINDTSKRAWQLLGEEERRIKIGEYEKYLDEIDKITTERLTAAGESITAERDDSLPTSIQTAIETAMDRVAAQFMAAATAQQAAAETPVTVNFNANVPGDAEVVLG